MLFHLCFVCIAICLLDLCTNSLIERPNVLFIVADDLRPTLGCYGYPLVITPNIDELASKSVVFNYAYAQQALCGPSRTSFLTGRRPDTTRLYDVHSYWRKAAGNYTTIPQHFKQNGYVTVSFGKVFHPGIVSGKTYDYPYSWSEPPYIPSTRKYKMKKEKLAASQEAQTEDSSKSVDELSTVETFNLQVCPGVDGKFYMNIVCPVNVSSQPEGTLPDIQTTGRAIDFLNKKATTRDRPFFLAVGYYKPHIPLKYPQEFLNYYPLSEKDIARDSVLPPKLPKVVWNPWTDLRERDDVKSLNISFPYGPVPRHFQRLMRQSYYAATTYMDDLVGKLLNTLEMAGFSNNTIIVFLGDHGWSLGEHQEWSKYSNFEVATRVPLIISVPGLTNFPSKLTSSSHVMSCDALVELVDLFPTLSDLAGLEIPKTCPPDPYKIPFCTEGVSLMPLLRASVKSMQKQNGKRPFQDQQVQFSKTYKEDRLINRICTQGYKDVDGKTWKNAVFSQYPRPSQSPQNNSNQPKTTDTDIMGYTMRTNEYRYTEWVKFYHSNFSVNWVELYGRELYKHTDDPDEDHNVADDTTYEHLVKVLSKQLHQGWRHALPVI